MDFFWRGLSYGRKQLTVREFLKKRVIRFIGFEDEIAVGVAAPALQSCGQVVPPI